MVWMKTRLIHGCRENHSWRVFTEDGCCFIFKRHFLRYFLYWQPREKAWGQHFSARASQPCWGEQWGIAPSETPHCGPGGPCLPTRPMDKWGFSQRPPCSPAVNILPPAPHTSCIWGGITPGTNRGYKVVLQKRTWGPGAHQADHKPAIHPRSKKGPQPAGLQ